MLQNLVTERNTLVESLERKTMELTANNAARDASDQSLQQLLAVSNEQVMQLKAELVAALQNQSELSKSEKKARRMSDFAEQKEQALRQRILSLSSENQSLIQSGTELANDLKRVSSRLDESDATNKELKGRLVDLESLLEQAREVEHDLEGKNEQLTSDCETLEKSALLLQSRLDHLETEMSRLQQDKNYLEKSLDSALKSETALELHSVRTLRSEIASLKASLHDREEYWGKVVVEKDRISADLDRQVQAYSLKTEQLEDDLIAAEDLGAECENMVWFI